MSLSQELRREPALEILQQALLGVIIIVIIVFLFCFVGFCWVFLELPWHVLEHTLFRVQYSKHRLLYLFLFHCLCFLFSCNPFVILKTLENLYHLGQFGCWSDSLGTIQNLEYINLSFSLIYGTSIKILSLSTSLFFLSLLFLCEFRKKPCTIPWSHWCHRRMNEKV